MTTNFPLRETFAHQTVSIGQEQQPVIVIENFLAHPEALAASAAKQTFSNTPGNFYPGLKGPLPPAYGETIVMRLGALIVRTFGIQANGVRLIEASFSLVTTPESELLPRQRIPHYDSDNPNQIAILHYLCGPEHGGTAFYRHARSGVELVTPERAAHFHALTRQDAAEFGEPPSGYPRASAAYEQIAAFEARFNRAIIYRSASLHSGVIPPNHPLTPDAKTGRLTANTFLVFFDRPMPSSGSSV